MMMKKRAKARRDKSSKLNKEVLNRNREGDSKTKKKTKRPTIDSSSNRRTIKTRTSPIATKEEVTNLGTTTPAAKAEERAAKVAIRGPLDRSALPARKSIPSLTSNSSMRKIPISTSL
jgi:hypothetical protein